MLCETLPNSNKNEILISQGAEAKILIGDFLGKKCIIKERFVKKYRIPEIDNKLTKQRVINESRNLARAYKSGINTPFVYFVDLINRRIYAEYIENSVMIKDLLRNIYISYQSVAENEALLDLMVTELGRILGKLHESDIVHGDLTTSNMLVKLDYPIHILETEEKVSFIIKQQKFAAIYLIDFGLSYVSQNVEDKAVDLYVLKRAIISANTKSVEIFDKMMDIYKKTYSKGETVLAQLNKVEMRGRKKIAFG